MIGFWNGSVYLTYAGLLAAAAGIFLSAGGKILPALFCLLFAGVCDMFDGKIARAMKRTEEEQLFGIQIDSLADLVCFGVLPAAVCFAAGARSVPECAVLALYVLAGLVRLGYFNVTEQRRQKEEGGNRRTYQGVPITTSAVALPAAYLLRPLCGDWFHWVLTGVMAVLGLFFVLNVRVPKPGKAGGIVLIALGAAVGVLFIVLAARGVL